MSIVIYYHTPDPGGADLFPTAEYFGMDEMIKALDRMEVLRKMGKPHVSMSVDNPNSVGQPGVDSVEDGKTPDGVPYTWVKRRQV